MKEMNNYTRVTEALFFCSGLKSIPSEVLKRAALRGEKAHEVVDALINGIGFLNLDTDIAGYIASFEQWGEKDFIAKPERFYCDKLKLTGEVDGIYKENGKFVLVDFKTPEKESKTWQLQLSAYAYLARESGYQIDRVEVIKLDKKGKEPKVFVYEERFDLYLKCLDVYRHFHENKDEEDYLSYI